MRYIIFFLLKYYMRNSRWRDSCLSFIKRILKTLPILLLCLSPSKIFIEKLVWILHLILAKRPRSNVRFRHESWTVKKAEHQRIDAFKLWYWRRLLRVPWTARRSNQSILKEISPGYSLEELMLKMKFQYFGHLMWRIDSFIWKDPEAGNNRRQVEKGMAEDVMVGWHHQLHRHEFQ